MSEFRSLEAKPLAARPGPAAVPGPTATAAEQLATGPGHDFSRVPAHAGINKRMASGTFQPSPGGDDVQGISSGGAGTVATTYVPEPGDKSTKIVFIQVMRESLDGVAAKPGAIVPSFGYQDADTTDEFYHVDYTAGEKDPYYNGDDPNDFGPQGNAVATPKVTASTTDTPNLSDAGIPAGGTKVNWDFRTAAFSAAGDDAGTYYGYADWAYEKTKGLAGTTSTKGTRTGTPGSKFEAAVKLFNSNRGFKMPGDGGGPSLLGGILGGILGGLGGALLGFALGGIPGAIIGGVAGALVGGAVGAFS